MRIAELIRRELTIARAAIPGPWTVCCSPTIHQHLCDELGGMPYLDSFHGEHLVVSRFDATDLVLLMPATTVHVFSAEEAVAFSRLPAADHKVRVVHVPPEGLTVEQAELYGSLRADGVEPARAAELAVVV